MKLYKFFLVNFLVVIAFSINAKTLEINNTDSISFPDSFSIMMNTNNNTGLEMDGTKFSVIADDTGRCALMIGTSPTYTELDYHIAMIKNNQKALPSNSPISIINEPVKTTIFNHDAVYTVLKDKTDITAIKFMRVYIMHGKNHQYQISFVNVSNLDMPTPCLTDLENRFEFIEK